MVMREVRADVAHLRNLFEQEGKAKFREPPALREAASSRLARYAEEETH